MSTFIAPPMAMAPMLGNGTGGAGGMSDGGCGCVCGVPGVLAALEYQARTGKGQFIEAGMLEAQGSMMGPAILDYTINGTANHGVLINEVGVSFAGGYGFSNFASCEDLSTANRPKLAVCVSK